MDALQLARIENDSKDAETRRDEAATDAAVARLTMAKARK